LHPSKVPYTLDTQIARYLDGDLGADTLLWSAGAVGESEVLDYRTGNRETAVNTTARVKRLVRVAMAVCIQQAGS
jgi:hypothetical protein